MRRHGDVWGSLQRRAGGRRAGPVAFVAVTLAYLFFAQLVVWLNDPVAAGAGLWPAAGVTLGALLLLPTRAWGWVVAAVVVAELGGDLAHGYGVAASAGWTLGNVVEPLVGAYLIRRTGNSSGSLTPVPNLVRFVALGVVAGPLVGASIGSTTTVLSFDMPLSQVWPKYFVGDALGVLIVAPLVLSLQARRSGRSPLEAVGLTVVSLATCVAVFVDWGGEWMTTMPYLLMPVLAWAALRFGVRGVSALAFVITMIGNAATAYGDGPFAQAGGPSGQSITMLQIFLAISVGFSLLLAALADHLTEQERTEARWRHQATHDPLTGLVNRSILDVVLADAVRQPGSAGRLSVVMCDVDAFKSVNDTWGHLAGDELLRTVAARMKSSVRPEDVVARLSGDEFVLVLRDADTSQADEVASRVMATVMGPVRLPNGEVVVPRLSMGVATCAQDESASGLVARADEAMYRAKALGGARVVTADDGAAPAPASLLL